MRARHVLGVAAVGATIALAGCGGDDPPAPSSQPSSQALPACNQLFVPGRPVDKVKVAAGCTNPTGAVQYPGAIVCMDGSDLWQVDPQTGAPAGYAPEGKPFRVVTGDVTADSGYRKAYAVCQKSKPAAAK